MKPFIGLFFSSFLFLTTMAQQDPSSISGTIKDTGALAIPAATVSLLRAGDSSLVRSMAASAGHFEFTKLAAGDYFVRVTAISFRSFAGCRLSVDGHEALPPISVMMLPADNVQLAQVVVSPRQPFIRQEIDKTVVDVSAMVSGAASNALEVLEKTPGVTVSSSGEISLNGRGGVLVLMNGRSTYMSSQDLAYYLKSIPGGLLDKIELIENPSARYDAAGNAIINIRWKKNRIAGFTGNILVAHSQGRYGRDNVALNLGYHHNKINLFGDISGSGEKNYTNDRYDRSFYTSTAELTTRQLLVNKQQNKLSGKNFSVGMDYAASAKTTLGLAINKNQNNRDGELGFSSLNYDASLTLDSSRTGNTIDHEERVNWATNLNMTHKFSESAAELSADFNYLNYKTNSNQQSQSSLSQPGSNLAAFLYLLPSDINIYTGKIDYVRPFKNRLFAEAGIKSSIVSNNNIANYYSVKGADQEIDNNRSNHFKYSENINAAYVNVRKGWTRFSTQVGLRVEDTQAEGNQLGNTSVKGSNFTKHYLKLFPSIFLSYKLDSVNKNTLTLSVTRRIARPNYQLLNPFVYYRDNYTYTEGNPFLNPQYQHRYEIKWQHKQFFRAGLSYNRFTQSIFQVTESVDNRFISKPDNIAGGYMVLLSTGLYVSPASWWNLNWEVLLSRVGLKGDGANGQLSFNAGIARINLMNQLRFDKGWNAELGGYYASKDFNGQSQTSGMVRVNAAVQKKIWKDKASIRLAADDIFHSWVYHNRSQNLKQATFFQTSESDTQRISLAFTYRFGKDANSRKRNHTDNASDEEKSRVQ